MNRLRACLLALGMSALVFAPSADAVVGGHDVPDGKYPYVAYVSIDGGLFACTGTLADPTHVITAGHCSSVTGPVAATPIGLPGQFIEVWLNSNKAHMGEGLHVLVDQVDVHPDYLFVNNQSGVPTDPSGHDVAILTLADTVNLPTVKVAGKGEDALWAPGTKATVAGFGITCEDCDVPDVMQEAQVPIATDAFATNAYGSSYEPETMLPAGYPQGGKDTCSGDSGGPLMVPAAGGTLRLAGDTSWGQGCAEPGFPGIYGRLGAPSMRDWIKSI